MPHTGKLKNHLGTFAIAICSKGLAQKNAHRESLRPSFRAGRALRQSHRKHLRAELSLHRI